MLPFLKLLFLTARIAIRMSLIRITLLMCGAACTKHFVHWFIYQMFHNDQFALRTFTWLEQVTIVGFGLVVVVIIVQDLLGHLYLLRAPDDKELADLRRKQQALLERLLEKNKH